MKDRNGKKLRYGDVCVLHIPIKKYFGRLTICDRYPEAYLNQECFSMRNKRGKIVLKDIPFSQLEIIGDVL